MAKLSAPLLSQEAHGQLGGTEYRRIGGRHVAGRRSLATPRRTARTSAARSAFVAATHAWRALSDADRLLYDQSAPAGMSGFNLWTQRATRTLTLAGTPPTVISVTRPSGMISFVAAYAWNEDPPNIAIQYNSSGTGALQVMFYWQPKQRTRRSPDPDRWVYLGSAPSMDRDAWFNTPSYADSYHILMRLVSIESGELFQTLTHFHP